MRKRIRIISMLLAAVFLVMGCSVTNAAAASADSDADSVDTVQGIIVSDGEDGGSDESTDTGKDFITDITAYDGMVIPENIYIGNVYVGGMSYGEARSAIADYLKEMGESTVKLTAVSGSLTPTADELGLAGDADETIQAALNYGTSGNLLTRYEIAKSLETESVEMALVISADEDSIRDYLDEHGSEISQMAVDYGLVRENGEFTVIEGQPGVEVDVEGSVTVITDAFSQGWQPGTDIELAVEKTEPKGSEEELALVQDVLGSFSTDYSSSSSGRKTNVALGCSNINGSVIYPGDTFSASDTMGSRNAENGYALATAYENGTTVDSYGGGVCQVSTTLYNAVIRAELEIVERHGHSLIVSYVDPSADAAIADGSKDFKFKNNTDAPIYIEGTTDGATIRFTIYGHETRPENRDVSFVSEVTGTTDPTTEYRATSNYSIGYVSRVQSSHTGRTARLWKVVTVDGVEESREVFNNTTYNMSPTIYEVGVASSSSEATAAMKSAIATNDYSTIQSAIAQWKNGGTASQTQEPEEEPVAEEPAAEEQAAEETDDTQQESSDDTFSTGTDESDTGDTGE